MNRFAARFAALDGTTRTSEKTAALAAYFAAAPDADKVWTVALLTGRRPRRAVTSTELRLWAAEAAGIPDWLFEESYTIVGDLAETIALLLPPPSVTQSATLPETLTSLITLPGLITLTGQPTHTRRAAVLNAWTPFPPPNASCSTSF